LTITSRADTMLGDRSSADSHLAEVALAAPDFVIKFTKYRSNRS